MRLGGKVAIVTGAGSGIGKALATRLAKDGAAVAIADLRNHDVAAAEIAKATGAKTLGLKVDVSVESDVERMAAETVRAFGCIDILVNNAAIVSSPETRAIQRDEKPEALVGAVSFLASDDAAFMTGQTMVVDGGSAMI